MTATLLSHQVTGALLRLKMLREEVEAEHLRGILEKGLQRGIFDHEFLAQVLYKFCWYSPEVATSRMMDLLHPYFPDIL